MGNKQTFIEINGRRYHAATGHRVIVGDQAQPAAPKAKAKAKSRQVAEHAVRHQPATSHTLMRHAVKKPAHAGKSLKAVGHLDNLAKQFLGHIEPRTPINQLDEQRLKHAQRIKRSQAISRFPSADPAYPPLLATTEPSRPALKTSTAAPHAKPQTTAELLERVMQQAVSHEQPPVKPKRRSKSKRRLGAASAMALAIILMVVITGQNSTQAKLQSASAAAGFTPVIPTYQPSGFKPAELEASKGLVAIGFRSSSDQRSYSMTQKATVGDTTALLTNYMLDQNANFQVVDAGGYKVYLYGQKNATWVSRGIWFDVHSFGSLDDSQLIRMATSS
jgi:hypothetical protein